MKTKIPSTKEDPELEQLVKALCTEQGLKRQQARESLIKKGSKSIPQVKDLLDSEKHICRWEAIKVIAGIGSPETIPLLLDSLLDESGDIRWIASEGLIRTGKYSVKPLLELILDKHDSVFVLNGAHHVFSELNNKDLLPADFPTEELLNHLKVSGNPSSLKILAHKILETLKTK